MLELACGGASFGNHYLLPDSFTSCQGWFGVKPSHLDGSEAYIYICVYIHVYIYIYLSLSLSLSPPPENRVSCPSSLG